MFSPVPSGWPSAAVPSFLCPFQWITRITSRGRIEECRGVAAVTAAAASWGQRVLAVCLRSHGPPAIRSENAAAKKRGGAAAAAKARKLSHSSRSQAAACGGAAAAAGGAELAYNARGPIGERRHGGAAAEL